MAPAHAGTLVSKLFKIQSIVHNDVIHIRMHKKMARRAYILTFILFFVAPQIILAAPQWPQWRANEFHTGTIEGKGVIQNPKIVWRYPLGGTLLPEHIVIQDIDKDNKIDILVINNGKLIRYTENFGIHWISPQSSIQSIYGFLSRDNRIQYIVAGNVSPFSSLSQLILINITTGQIAAESPIIQNGIGAVKIKDINRDGFEEIIWHPAFSNTVWVYATKNNSFELLWETTIPNYISDPFSFSPMIIGDLNNDGHDEIIIAGGRGLRPIIVIDRNGNILDRLDYGEKSGETGGKNHFVSILEGENPGLVIVGGWPRSENYMFQGIGVFKMDGNTVREIWVKEIVPDGLSYLASPLVDINGDQKPEIVINTLKLDAGPKDIEIYDLETGGIIWRQAGKLINILNKDSDGSSDLIIQKENELNFSLIEFSPQPQQKQELLPVNTYALPENDLVFAPPELPIRTLESNRSKQPHYFQTPSSCKIQQQYTFTRLDQNTNLIRMSEACPTKNMAQKILRWINERIFFQLSKQENIIERSQNIAFLGSDINHRGRCTPASFLFQIDNKIIRLEKGYFSRKIKEKDFIVLNNFYKNQWGKWGNTHGTEVAIITDRDGDGRNEIVTINAKNELQEIKNVLEAPIVTTLYRGSTQELLSFDHDNDGKKELIVRDYLSVPKIALLDSRNKILWEHEFADASNITGFSYGDFNDDGTQDVVAFVRTPLHTYPYETFVLNGKDGTTLFHNDKFGAYSNATSIVLDINRDKKEDIIFNANVFKMVILSPSDDTTIFPGVNIASPDFPDYGGVPIFIKFNGRVAQFVSAGDSKSTIGFKTGNGVSQITWHAPHQFVNQELLSLPTVIHRGKNKSPLLINGTADGKLIARNELSGDTEWTIKLMNGAIAADDQTIINQLSSVVTADIDGDTAMEIVVGGYDGWLYALEGESGKLEWSINIHNAVGDPILGDVDGDGLIDILAPTADGYLNLVK